MRRSVTLGQNVYVPVLSLRTSSAILVCAGLRTMVNSNCRLNPKGTVAICAAPSPDEPELGIKYPSLKRLQFLSTGQPTIIGFAVVETSEPYTREYESKQQAYGPFCHQLGKVWFIQSGIPLQSYKGLGFQYDSDGEIVPHEEVKETKNPLNAKEKGELKRFEAAIKRKADPFVCYCGTIDCFNPEDAELLLDNANCLASLRPLSMKSFEYRAKLFQAMTDCADHKVKVEELLQSDVETVCQHLQTTSDSEAKHKNGDRSSKNTQAIKDDETDFDLRSYTGENHDQTWRIAEYLLHSESAIGIENARKIVGNALRSNETDASLLFLKAYVHAFEPDGCDQSLEYLNKANEEQPPTPHPKSSVDPQTWECKIRHRIALSYLRKGDEASAYWEAQKIVDVDLLPDSPEYLRFAADTAKKCGKVLNEKQYLARSLWFDPYDKTSVQRLDLLTGVNAVKSSFFELQARFPKRANKSYQTIEAN